MNEANEQAFLLPHLMTRRNSLLMQSEVLVMESLGWFLARHPVAGEALARLVDVDGPITWHVEVPISDRARIDLLGQDADGLPRIVVEGKIHEVFDGDQLAFYARWQQDKLAGHNALTSALVVLGPEWRRMNGEKALQDRVGLTDTFRRIRYVGFNQVFAAVGAVLPDDPNRNWEQFLAMYHFCDGAMASPFTLAEVAESWEERVADYRRLSLALTETLQRALFVRALAPQTDILPWTKDSYRYVKLPGIATTPAIGLFPELGGVPFALRYNPRYTSDVPAVADRLRGSGIDYEANPATGDLSVRLHVPIGASHFEMVDGLRAEVERIFAVVHPESPAFAA